LTILNQLKPENITSVSKQLMSLGIDNIELLDEVIRRIYSPHFGYLFAMLCSKLNEQLPAEHTWLVKQAEDDVAYKILTVFGR